jgi:prepilin peptidase CpaA
MDILTLLVLGLMPTLMIVAGLHDLVTMKIPNWISLALVAAFPVAALLAGLTPADIGLHFAVGVAALLLGMAMFALNWVGGGDAKVMAAGCLWMGLSGSLMFLLYSALAGGVFSLALLTARKIAPSYPGVPGWATRLLEPKGDIPYGVALAAGALLSFPASDLVAAFTG